MAQNNIPAVGWGQDPSFDVLASAAVAARRLWLFAEAIREHAVQQEITGEHRSSADEMDAAIASVEALAMAFDNAVCAGLGLMPDASESAQPRVVDDHGLTMHFAEGAVWTKGAEALVSVCVNETMVARQVCEATRTPHEEHVWVHMIGDWFSSLGARLPVVMELSTPVARDAE